MTQPALLVRPYRLPGDVEALVRIYEDSYAHYLSIETEPPIVAHTLEHTRRRFARLSLDADRCLLVALASDEIVGLIEARMVRNPDNGFAGAYVEQVSVATAWRGRGVGTRLMHEVEQWAMSQGAVSVALDTLLANEGARRLYERLGYVSRAVVMEKRLR